MARSATRALVVAAVVGLASLTVSVSAHATAPSPGCKPVHGKPAYPPGQCKPPAADPSTVAHGQKVVVTTGEGQFDPTTSVDVTLHSTVTSLGSRLVNSGGEAVISFTVPATVPAGVHHVVFTGSFFGVLRSVSVPFTVTKVTAGQTGGAASGATTGSSSSSSTGTTTGGSAASATGGTVGITTGPATSPSGGTTGTASGSTGGTGPGESAIPADKSSSAFSFGLMALLAVGLLGAGILFFVARRRRNA